MQRRAVHGTLARIAGVRGCSFVAATYRGRVSASDLFPFPTTELPDHVREAMIEARNTTMQSDQQGDVWGLMSPSEFGGLELTHPCLFDVLSQSKAAKGYIAVHDHAFLVTFVLINFASKEQKGRYLPQMSDGSTRVAWAIAELHAPNDPAEAKCRAVVDDSTASISLHGTKMIVQQESPSAFLVLADVTAGEKGKSGLALIWVDAATQGISLRDGELRLDNAKVPLDSIIVQAGDAYRACMTSMLAASYAIAAAKISCMNESPVSTPFIAALTYALESIGSALSANIERGVQDTFLESVATTTLLERLQIYQMHSESRFTGPLNIHATSSSIIAKAGACCGVEEAALLFNQTGTIETIQQRTAVALGFIDQLPELVFADAERKSLATLISRFGTAVRTLAVRFGSTVSERDLALRRASSIASLIFASVAVLARAQRSIAGKLPTAEHEKNLALYWVRFAMDVAEAQLEDITTPTRTTDDLHARLCAEILETCCKGTS